MKLTFINSNDEILVIPQNDKYIMQKWSGFGDSVHSLITDKAPDQIGSTVINRIFELRTLNIQFAIKASNRQEVFNLRREVLGILNPMYEQGTLKWEQNDGTIYQIDVELDSLQMPGGDAQGNTFQVVQLSLLAEDPRWYDEEITETSIPVDGVAFDVKNLGDIRTDCLITIEGPISSPEIINLDTGKRIKINYSLSTDEKIIIDTSFGKKTLLFENEDGYRYRAMNLLSLDSELFDLKVGSNSLIVNGVDTNENTNVFIEFYNKYLGI